MNRDPSVESVSDIQRNTAAVVSMPPLTTPRMQDKHAIHDRLAAQPDAPSVVERLEGERWQSFAQRWDACLRGDHLGLTHRFLDCARHLQMDGYRLTPLALLDGAGTAVGVASCFRSYADAADLGSPRLRRAIGVIRGFLPNFLRYEVIEVGLPAGVGFPVRAQDLHAFETIIVDVMNEAARTPNALVLVRDIDPQSAAQSEAVLRALGFKQLPMPATMVVSLPYGSFEAYKKNMRAKYRRLLNERMAKTESIRCEVLSDFAALIPEMMTLWRDLYSRAERYHRLLITPEFLVAVNALEESGALVLRRDDGSIAAFGLLYRDGETLRGTIGGFTKDAALDEGVYFRMLYETVRYAADNGFRAAALGQSTAGPKMSIGAVPVPLTAWIWRPSRMGRGILSWLISTLMRPPPPPSNRNVFREESPPPRDAALTDHAWVVADNQIKSEEKPQ